MIPLIVTAHLNGPVATSDGVFQLDSILEHFAWRLKGRPTFEMGAPAANFEIPVKKIEFDGGWLWSCSQGLAKSKCDSLVYYQRKFPLERGRMLKAKDRKINIGAGPTKGFRIPLPLSQFDSVVWHLVGDEGEVQAMLDMVTHLGKKRNVGWGRISKWQVEPVDFNWSLVRAEGGPACPLPLPVAKSLGLDFDERDAVLVGYRPPYWHRDSKAMCLLPEVAE